MPDLLSLTRPFLSGGGEVHPTATGGALLTIPPKGHGYADAQIGDTQGRPRHAFRWRPPLRLTIEARVDPPAPSGTWGFGFWNDPFSVSLGQAGAARRWPCGPRALWFFYASPPNAFGFTGGAQDGWRAMSIDSPSIHPVLLTPAALIAVTLAQVPFVRESVMRLALRQVTASEAQLAIPDGDLHAYELLWETDQAIFLVDRKVVLRAPHPPRGPLGFVAWIDNQYAVATPQRGVSFGTLATTRAQSLLLTRAILSSPSASPGDPGCSTFCCSTWMRS